jgi:hypothetical protein
MTNARPLARESHKLNFATFLLFVVATIVGCNTPSNNNSKNEPKAKPSEKVEKVRFLIIAGGVTDALKDRKISSLAFSKQNSKQFNVTEFMANDGTTYENKSANGLSPGAFSLYESDVVRTNGPTTAGVLFEKKPAIDEFRLTRIEEIGTVRLAGSDGELQVFDAAYKLFSASIDRIAGKD